MKKFVLAFFSVDYFLYIYNIFKDIMHKTNSINDLMKLDKFKTHLKSNVELISSKKYTKITLHGVSQKFYTLRTLGYHILSYENNDYLFEFVEKSDHIQINAKSKVDIQNAMNEFGISK